MRKCFLSALLLTFVVAGLAQAQIAVEPVTPNASPEARALLSAIYRLSGRNILSGQHNYIGAKSKYTDQAHFVTGKWPTLWSSDFGFAAKGNDDIHARDTMVAEARRQFGDGSLIALTWRAVRPLEDEPAGLKESVQAKLTGEQWQELLTPDTPLHKRWEAHIDTAAGYLKRLQDAKIPVLWRPYHEANGNWFWWGGRKGENGFVALYRMTYDRLVNYHHLDNLVWVWNSNAPTGANAGPYADFFPGLRYCDVLAADVYGEFKQSYHDDLAALANGRPIALGEVGRVPTPAVLKDQAKWAWFMVWADLLRMSKVEVVKELFDDPHTLSRGDPLPGKN